MSDQNIRNEYGETVLISHPKRKVRSAAFDSDSPTQVANWYVKQNLSAMGLGQSRMEDEADSFASRSRTAGPVIRFSGEKDIAGSKVVFYNQSVMGLEIFDARMGVHIDASEMAVTSAQSSMHGQVTVANADQMSDQTESEKLTNAALKKLLGITLSNMKAGRIQRQVIYRFEPDQRTEAVEDDHEGCFGGHSHQELTLPELPEAMKKGNHYIVNEILFRASRHKDEPPVNWRALLEPESGAVLYIRALVANASGLVYDRDPQTQTGANVTGASTNVELNPFRSTVTLEGLIPSAPQQLSGQYVEITETSAPNIPPPTAPNPPATFNYNVRDDNFSAVNAYYHCDRLFRTMADYGFSVGGYFNGTQFPVPVDHRALGNAVNAQAPGNAMGNGLGELRFALLQAGEDVGMATSNRVVWHEFGHALLWDHVNSPNFGFAHSAGDSLAAILNDPGSAEPDRFDTFPWVQEGTPIGRRHDRAVADGWAWFGPQYNTQYQGEQILCTTLFRLYRALGGDGGTVETQTRASRTVAYLIFKAIGLLVATTPIPEVFVTNMQNADLTTASFKGIPGGALHKVVRWAFEKQGLFQPAAAPGMGNTVSTEGNPPDVDIYIDDGRNGEYEYQPNHWSCQDMWVRHAPDGGLTHQQPMVGLTNYMYVRVKNRGLLTANGVHVDAYHTLPGTGLAFPDDWAAMDTPSLPAGGPIPAGGETIVGPFAFTPTEVGHECLLAIAQCGDDPGNDTTITGTIPEYRFVPFDNNIGQRNVHPVYPSLKHLIKMFFKHLIWVRNPLQTQATCRIEIELPQFLSQLGWELRVVSRGGRKFELAPRGERKVKLFMKPGKLFSKQDAQQAIANGDHEIKILTYLEDELSGGMTYPLSFDAKWGKAKAGPEVESDAFTEASPGETAGPAKAGPRRASTMEEVLGSLRDAPQALTGKPGLDGRIRTVRIEFDLEDEA